MKLIDIARNIDKSDSNECNIHIEEIGYEFDLNISYVDQERLKAYWVGNWYCTDSYVGYRMYFLDDEPVAFSIQHGRKCDEQFKWFSEELALKVRDYIISLMDKKEDNLRINLWDINDDIGDSYKIDYNKQVLNWENALLNNETVEILEEIEEGSTYGIHTKLLVRLTSGEERIIDIEELEFKFHLK